jgi:copper chaperone CopZ
MKTNRPNSVAVNTPFFSKFVASALAPWLAVAMLGVSAVATAQGTSTAAQNADAPTAVTKISVNGMVCTFCAQGIEKRLTAMPQTKEVYVDLKQKLVLAEAKSGQQFDSAKLKSEIEDAGYEVVKIEPAKETLAALKADLKAKSK